MAWPEVPPQWHHWRWWLSYQYSCSLRHVYLYSDGDTHSDQYADQRAYRHYRCVGYVYTYFHSYLCVHVRSYLHGYLHGYRHCLHDHLL